MKWNRNGGLFSENVTTLIKVSHQPNTVTHEKYSMRSSCSRHNGRHWRKSRKYSTGMAVCAFVGDNGVQNFSVGLDKWLEAENRMQATEPKNPYPFNGEIDYRQRHHYEPIVKTNKPPGICCKQLKICQNALYSRVPHSFANINKI